MKTYYGCMPCFINQVLGTVKRITDDEQVLKESVDETLKLLQSLDMSASPPATAQKIHKIIRGITGVTDPYKKEKIEYNKFAMSLIPELKKSLEGSKDLFVDLVKLSIAGNIIDFGKHENLKQEDVIKSINEAMNKKVSVKDVELLRKSIDKASNILYLGDNSGEIVFDKLLIESLPKEKITYVVRGNPIINDVTIEDAKDVGMTDIVEVIDNGSDAPGTVLELCSDEFIKRFNSADIVIAKGQGNYETLSDVNRDIFFLLQVKCSVVATSISQPIGSFIVKHKS